MITTTRPDLPEFRDGIRNWLANVGPDDLRGVELYAFGQDVTPIRASRESLAHWSKILFEGGYMCASWPIEYGGAGLSIEEQSVVAEEFSHARLPHLDRGMGEHLVGPAIIAHGTPSQRQRFLPPIISGEHNYCQGFSEPNAGSDLASLTTKGIVLGDELLITGQKVWTSGFEGSNMIFCLCRTDPTVSPHAGISFVLIPIENEDGSSNGVEFRSIRQLSGYRTFAETFLNEARASLDNVIGGLGSGWSVAMTTLGCERGGAVTQHLAFRREFDQLLNEARCRKMTSDAVLRQNLARAHINVELMRYRGLDVLAAAQRGNPNAVDPTGSLNKLHWSEYQRWFGEIAMEVLGMKGGLVEDDYGLSPLQEIFMATRSHTIWGGSSEIQRNIIAERVLGLPKEPRQ